MEMSEVVDLLCGRFNTGIAVGGRVIERLMFIQEAVKANPKMCYIIHYAPGTRMSVSYWNPEAAECTISLEMTDGNGDIIGSVIRHLKVNKIRGKSEVELENSEQHAICVDAAHPEEKEFRFSLDISFVDGSTETYDPSEEGTAGSDENDEESSTNLLDRLKRLSKRMSSMHILADDIVTKEHKLHEASEDVNYRAQCWPIIQIVAVGIISFVYAYHMRGFFRTRKLV